MTEANFSSSQIESIMDDIYDHQLNNIVYLNMTNSSQDLQSVSKSADILADAPNLQLFDVYTNEAWSPSFYDYYFYVLDFSCSYC